MRFVALVAAFLIGLVAGIATSPHSQENDGAKLQRRESVNKSN